MLQPDPERIDSNAWAARADRGDAGQIQALGIQTWPTDYWVLANDGNDEAVVVPVTLCTPWTIIGSLDTNVSPAKFSVAVRTEGDQSWMAEALDSTTPGITPILRVVRLALDGDEAVTMLRTELEV